MDTSISIYNGIKLTRNRKGAAAVEDDAIKVSAPLTKKH
jgi:hypothetical protein